MIVSFGRFRCEVLNGILFDDPPPRAFHHPRGYNTCWTRLQIQHGLPAFQVQVSSATRPEETLLSARSLGRLHRWRGDKWDCQTQQHDGHGCPFEVTFNVFFGSKPLDNLPPSNHDAIACLLRVTQCKLANFEYFLYQVIPGLHLDLESMPLLVCVDKVNFPSRAPMIEIAEYQVRVCHDAVDATFSWAFLKFGGRNAIWFI
jgi:hypothetical protein